MATNSSSARSDVLNSWKEIAAYLGRGVRTVQRYERDLGLPVRRPHGRSRSAVVALPEELDIWLRHAPGGQGVPPPLAKVLEPVREVRKTIHNSAQLRDQCHAVRAAHADAVAKLMDTVRLLGGNHSPQANKGNGTAAGNTSN